MSYTNPAAVKELIYAALKASRGDGEDTFIDSLDRFYQERGFLSNKQIDSLRNIVARGQSINKDAPSPLFPVGHKVGHLTVLKSLTSKTRLFRCDCGTEVKLRYKAVDGGNYSRCSVKCTLDDNKKKDWHPNGYWTPDRLLKIIKETKATGPSDFKDTRVLAGYYQVRKTNRKFKSRAEAAFEANRAPAPKLSSAKSLVIDLRKLRGNTPRVGLVPHKASLWDTAPGIVGIGIGGLAGFFIFLCLLFSGMGK